MKAEPGLTSGMPETEKVDQFMKELKHPMKALAQQLRECILSADKSITEGIFWKAPVFYFSGKMKPFDPKEYKRYIVGFNFFKNDHLRVIFLRGAEVSDKTGLLEGDYADGRRLASFTSSDDLKSKEKALKAILKELVKTVNK